MNDATPLGAGPPARGMERMKLKSQSRHDLHLRVEKALHQRWHRADGVASPQSQGS